METTVFNPAQQYMLKVLSQVETEEELLELQQLISSHYAQKVEDEMDKLWEQGLWSNDKNEAILKEHLRTPYSRRER